MFYKFPVILPKNANYRCNLTRNNSWWSKVPMGPPDPIFGVTDAFNKDKNPNKILLGSGSYRDDDGKPYVLPSIRKAEEILMSKNLNKEYPPMGGQPEFCKLAAELAFGEGSEITSKCLNATVQSLSGTGALSLGAFFIKRFFPGDKVVYLPNPTWGNHKAVMLTAGLEPKSYKYYDPKTSCLDFEGMLCDLTEMPENSVVLFHACAHNPTGMDPSEDQWKELSKVVAEHCLFPFFDIAYQGFASGDTDKDAQAVRQFACDGHQFLLAQSFSKNMGLYGERVGTLSVVGSSQEEADKIRSQLNIIIRSIYSVPPVHGERLVTEVLSNPELKCQWEAEVKGMADRIIGIRKTLVERLKKEGSTKNWEHITKQIGMFSYTGLTPEQVDKLAKEHGVYMTKDGRMSVAGVTCNNVDALAKAMHAVTK